MTNDNMYQVFNGKVTSLSDIQAMRRGDLPPVRDWQETPTLAQRIFSLLPLATVTDTYCRIIDLSKWDSDLSIQKVIDMGFSAAIVKATQNNFVDSLFDTWVNQAAVANFPLGVYHFSDPAGRPAVEQARHFFNVADGVPQLSWNDDAEWTGGLSPTALNRWHFDFMGELSALAPAEDKKGIYTRVEWWDRVVAPADWAKMYDLWAARWAEWLDGPWSDGKYVPRDWTDWVMWQYKSDSWDHNYFHGTCEEMVAYYIDEEEPPVGDYVTRDEFNLLVQKVNDLDEALTQAEDRITDNATKIGLLQHALDTHEHEGSAAGMMIVTDEKTLAKKIGGWNDAKPPKPIIYPYFYEPRIRWNMNDRLFVVPDHITRADGGHDFYTLVPGQNGKNFVPDTEPLFVLADDIKPV